MPPNGVRIAVLKSVLVGTHFVGRCGATVVKTKHRVETEDGEGFRASVDHHYSRAVQYDFFVPTKLWAVPDSS